MTATLSNTDTRVSSSNSYYYCLQPLELPVPSIHKRSWSLRDTVQQLMLVVAAAGVAFIVLIATFTEQSGGLMHRASVLSWSSRRRHVYTFDSSPPGCEALASTLPVKSIQCEALKDINEEYTIHSRLGNGGQAVVAEVIHKTNGNHYVARFPKPFILERDVKYGRRLCGVPNVAQLVDVTCHQGLTYDEFMATRQGKPIENKGATNIAVVFEKCGGKPLSTYMLESGCTTFTYNEIKSLLRELRETLLGIHQRGVQHKDIGINNVFYNRDTQKVCIIDLGKATKFPEWMVATPEDVEDADQIEVLERFGYNNTMRGSNLQTVRSSDDIIAIGSVLARLLSLPKPWTKQVERDFKNDTITYYTHLLELRGTDELIKLQRKYDWFVLPRNMTARLQDFPSKRTDLDWKKMYSNDCNNELLTDDALSFLYGLHQYSYVERRKFFLNAHNHPFINT